jgi:hypothetical protein
MEPNHLDYKPNHFLVRSRNQTDDTITRSSKIGIHFVLFSDNKCNNTSTMSSNLDLSQFLLKWHPFVRKAKWSDQVSF